MPAVAHLSHRQRVFRLLEELPQCGVAEISDILGISQSTLRADLRALAREGHPVYLLGDDVFFGQPGFAGERAAPDHSFTRRMHANLDSKQAIARWAAGLVQDGDTILMDASTTVYHLAACLDDRRGLVVLTNGIETGRRMARNPSNTVILVAGILRTDGSAVVGPLDEPGLRKQHIKTAFLSCMGFSFAAGLTESDADEAAVKQQMVRLAESTVALIDSSKFGQVYPVPFARANQVAHIFSDGRLEPHWADQMQKSSIVLTRCL